MLRDQRMIIYESMAGGNIIELINSLENVIIAGPVSNKEIKEAEKELGLSFSNEYKTFLSKFGKILADGIEIVGITPKNPKSKNVVTITKREWEYNPLVPKNLYVVENVGIEGIIIWQDKNGAIYQSSPNKKPKKINNNLVEYIKSL